jgi:hypothetical protein
MMNRLLNFVGSQENIERFAVRWSAGVSIFAVATAAVIAAVALFK